MFFLLLAAWSMLRSRFSYKRYDAETIEWGRPQPSLLQRWRAKMGSIQFRLQGLAKRRMSNTAPKPTPSAPATVCVLPPKKPAGPMLPLFGSTISAPNSKPKEGFAWEETNGIE
jgi:hypothetical protein